MLDVTFSGEIFERFILEYLFPGGFFFLFREKFCLLIFPEDITIIHQYNLFDLNQELKNS